MQNQLELFPQVVVAFPKKRAKSKRSAPKRQSASVILPFPMLTNRHFIAATAKHLAELSVGHEDLSPEAVAYWDVTVFDLIRVSSVTGLTSRQYMNRILTFRHEVGLVLQAEFAAEEAAHRV